MPLTGNVSANIHELTHHGSRPRTHKQIVAIAIAAAERQKKRNARGSGYECDSKDASQCPNPEQAAPIQLALPAWIPTETDGNPRTGWIGVDSSWIAGLKYTPERGAVMTVRKGGKEYPYPGFGVREFRQWVQSRSKGKWWWRHVGYPMKDAGPVKMDRTSQPGSQPAAPPPVGSPAPNPASEVFADANNNQPRENEFPPWVRNPRASQAPAVPASTGGGVGSAPGFSGTSGGHPFYQFITPDDLYAGYYGQPLETFVATNPQQVFRTKGDLTHQDILQRMYEDMPYEKRRLAPDFPTSRTYALHHDWVLGRTGNVYGHRVTSFWNNSYQDDAVKAYVLQQIKEGKLHPEHDLISFRGNDGLQRAGEFVNYTPTEEEKASRQWTHDEIERAHLDPAFKRQILGSAARKFKVHPMAEAMRKLGLLAPGQSWRSPLEAQRPGTPIQSSRWTGPVHPLFSTGIDGPIKWAPYNKYTMADVMGWLQRHVHPGVTEQHLAAMAGWLPGTELHVTDAGPLSSGTTQEPSSLTLNSDSPFDSSRTLTGRAYSASREIFSKYLGVTPRLENEHMLIGSQPGNKFRGASGPVLLRQIRAAHEIGIPRINWFSAFVTPEQAAEVNAHPFTGGLHWPLMGADGFVPPHLIRSMPPAVRDEAYRMSEGRFGGGKVSVFSDMMMSPKAREWYTENPISHDSFVDTRPGSYSRKAIERHVAEHAAAYGHAPPIHDEAMPKEPLPSGPTRDRIPVKPLAFQPSWVHLARIHRRVYHPAIEHLLASGSLHPEFFDAYFCHG